MKKFTSSAQQSISMHYYRGVPAHINNKFKNHRVDAAYISSIGAKKYKHVNLGIIAKKEVLSVLVIPNNTSKDDKESASSNVLAKILGIRGEVIIGDKALQHYLAKKEYIDLAKVWSEKYNLPFVFALLCYHKDAKLYKTIEKSFIKTKIKIPQYILTQASQRTGIAKKDILHYLQYISYDLDKKAKLGLKKFYRLAK